MMGILFFKSPCRTLQTVLECLQRKTKNDSQRGHNQLYVLAVIFLYNIIFCGYLENSREQYVDSVHHFHQNYPCYR